MSQAYIIISSFHLFIYFHPTLFDSLTQAVIRYLQKAMLMAAIFLHVQPFRLVPSRLICPHSCIDPHTMTAGRAFCLARTWLPEAAAESLASSSDVKKSPSPSESRLFLSICVSLQLSFIPPHSSRRSEGNIPPRRALLIDTCFVTRASVNAPSHLTNTHWHKSRCDDSHTQIPVLVTPLMFHIFTPSSCSGPKAFTRVSAEYTLLYVLLFSRGHRLLALHGRTAAWTGGLISRNYSLLVPEPQRHARHL